MIFVHIEQMFPCWNTARDTVESYMPDHLEFVSLDDNTIGLDFMWFLQLMRSTPTEELPLMQKLQAQLNGQINLYCKGELNDSLSKLLYAPLNNRTLRVINDTLNTYEYARRQRRESTLLEVIKHVLGIECCYAVQNPEKKIYSI